ncbi:hypothetical protein SAMN04488527_1148 [Aliiroseovarius crassostreae]|uniref:Uncharacterized protein n=1 Tax=Aliiroseovarius crassostreae TaxID=154981 RepID=A0A0P7IU58_9RHOB|nr:hypothetical protein [Aliiroseovarius crassostreae]KPN62366.1 hypothetical protein AKJ29_09000 [Aliiroseovarius crassostreae]SFU74902.1 hypothetical protein SAMN04488527_1148 [Aliiroseovarius crassostreae]
MPNYVLDEDQPVSGSTTQIFDCKICLLLVGPDEPGKIAAHIIQYENLELDDAVMVLPHVSGRTAGDVVSRLGDDGNKFKNKMSDEMLAVRNQFLRDIEGKFDA